MLCNSKTYNVCCKYRSSLERKSRKKFVNFAVASINSSVSLFLSQLRHAFSVTLEGKALTLLGKPQNKVVRKCKNRKRILLINFGEKPLLVYSAFGGVRGKLKLSFHILQDGHASAGSKSTGWQK